MIIASQIQSYVYSIVLWFIIGPLIAERVKEVGPTIAKHFIVQYVLGVSKKVNTLCLGVSNSTNDTDL